MNGHVGFLCGNTFGQKENLLQQEIRGRVLQDPESQGLEILSGINYLFIFLLCHG